MQSTDLQVIKEIPGYKVILKTVLKSQIQQLVSRRIDTVKFLNLRTPNFCCKLPKVQTKRPSLRVFRQKDADGIANSEDPDQTAPLGAV